MTCKLLILIRKRDVQAQMLKFGVTQYSNGKIYIDRINQPLSYIQHEPVALCNGEIFCFLRGRF